MPVLDSHHDKKAERLARDGEGSVIVERAGVRIRLEDAHAVHPVHRQGESVAKGTALPLPRHRAWDAQKVLSCAQQGFVRVEVHPEDAVRQVERYEVAETNLSSQGDSP